MTSEIFNLILALIGGILLGAMFFGGLWWTAQKVITSKLSALSILVSMLLRMGLTLTGFYLVSGGQLSRLLFCFLGFMVARYTVLTLNHRNQSPLSQEVNDAP